MQLPCYLLFDDRGISDTKTQSFEAFYSKFLDQKVARVGQFFNSLMPSFSNKAAVLIHAIRMMPPTQLTFVHGDFFPGNVLVDKDLTRVTGIIDFGSFTLYGNYLIDVAGAFGFYKMYDPDRKSIRTRMLPRILERLTLAEQPHFFQFLLAHAILTSDLYAPEADPRQDGHFQWASEIIAEDYYWVEALK